jgi:hypothetical protein
VGTVSIHEHDSLDRCTCTQRALSAICPVHPLGHDSRDSSLDYSRLRPALEEMQPEAPLRFDERDGLLVMDLLTAVAAGAALAVMLLIVVGVIQVPA